MMNRNQMFEIAVKGLQAQGYRQAQSATGICMFRAPDGRKCAVGHLVSDEFLSKVRKEYGIPDNAKFEPTTPDLLRAMAREGLIANEDQKFLKDLQGIHDLARTPDQMKYGLQLFARINELNVSGLGLY